MRLSARIGVVARTRLEAVAARFGWTLSDAVRAAAIIGSGGSLAAARECNQIIDDRFEVVRPHVQDRLRPAPPVTQASTLEIVKARFPPGYESIDADFKGFVLLGIRRLESMRPTDG